ncbi:MAG TPA: hypothetical protein VIG79_00720 [Lapillicoccus sp.]|uniref:hypothetical protein n=1 Tax=Lapillicoccus sp. TaxID=1909287 RepID=UPI002F95DC35
MSLLELLAELTRRGGVAGHADLVAAGSRSSLRRALADGHVVRDARADTRSRVPMTADGPLIACTESPRTSARRRTGGGRRRTDRTDRG